MGLASTTFNLFEMGLGSRREAHWCCTPNNRRPQPLLYTTSTSHWPCSPLKALWPPLQHSASEPPSPSLVWLHGFYTKCLLSSGALSLYPCLPLDQVLRLRGGCRSSCCQRANDRGATSRLSCPHTSATASAIAEPLDTSHNGLAKDSTTHISRQLSSQTARRCSFHMFWQTAAGVTVLNAGR